MTDKLKKIFRVSRTAVYIGLASIALLVLVSASDKDFEITKNLDIFVSLFQQVDAFYVDEKSPQELIESSIKGMLESLDPYTTYIPASEMDDFKFMTTGQYGGIGALIRKAGNYTMISEVYEGSPALKAGLNAGDTILSVNGVSVKDKEISSVSEMLKGEPNTELTLVIHGFKKHIPVTKTFKRENISIKNVPYSGILPDNIGYIRLTGFTKDASREVKEAFLSLKSKGAKSVILDLRGNPGGLLNEAVDITNIWVKKGQEIVNTHGKAKQWDNIYKTGKSPEDTIIPLAILVNRGSASASEIVSGSLQDLDRAIVVGQRTFGKGLVQTTRPLSYDANLKITTAKYYIPSGRCIQALDYTHRNADGSVGHVPDSLISEFRTKNGRSVFDGGGIQPDVNIGNENPANISISLYANNVFFDYATKFHAEHDTIATADEFAITDEIFNDFLQFVENSNFEYNTASNEKLDELIEVAKQEGYYSLAKEDIETLQAKLISDKVKDTKTFRKEVESFLTDEIVSRYYYQSGRIVCNLKDDAQVNKAIELLKNKNTVYSILHGTFAGSEIKLALDK